MAIHFMCTIIFHVAFDRTLDEFSTQLCATRHEESSLFLTLSLFLSLFLSVWVSSSFTTYHFISFYRGKWLREIKPLSFAMGQKCPGHCPQNVCKMCACVYMSVSSRCVISHLFDKGATSTLVMMMIMTMMLLSLHRSSEPKKNYIMMVCERPLKSG